LLKDDAIPNFCKVEYDIEQGNIRDIALAVDQALDSRGVLNSIKPGQTVAITGGSREINHMPEIFRQLVKRVRAIGAKPFIFPAMGSHGGSTAKGQYEVLTGYGITPEYVGCEIRSSMETVLIGRSASNLPVYVDKCAYEAECIIVVGRIKPHTDFRGPVESGLMKMMAIGMGKQHGAAICHKEGFDRMAKNVWEFGQVMLEKTNVVFGLSIIEDIFHNTYRIDAVPAKLIPIEEPSLLNIAKELIPGIPFDKIDILFVQEIGKDISGAGMDPNITGRSGFMGMWKPYAQVIVVTDITEKSHHNGAGLGFADITTRRAYEKFDFEMTYPNGITSCDISGMKIPPVMPNDELAFRHAVHIATKVDPAIGCRIVWIKNTCHMKRFYISEALIPEAIHNDRLRILTQPSPISFDEDGNVAFVDWD
ncbi:MAG: lactate racemase domain-containing protein, partial [Clostridia bacterium]|nr:lactate racemase domain-containing protein [Clostridia bacterium]